MTSKKSKVQPHEEDDAEQMEAKTDSGEDSSDDENPDIYKGDEVCFRILCEGGLE